MSTPLDRARAAISLRRWDLALEALEVARAEDPTDPAAHALYSQALYRQQRYFEAQAAAREAISAAPDWGVGYFWLAWSYLSNGLLEPPQIQQAREAAEEALRCDPDDPDFRALMANTALVEGDADEAAMHARTGLIHDPEHEGCLEALVASQKDAPSEKQQTLLRLVQLNPESVFAHRHLATAALAAGTPVAAFQHARSAVELDPADADARDTYHEVVQHQHPCIRFLLWSGEAWQRYVWLSALGGLPLVALLIIKGDAKLDDRDPWFWVAFCIFLFFVSYGLLTRVLAELIASHSRRLRALLPEAATTRRKFYVAAGIMSLLAICVGLAVWWRGPVPLIAFMHGGTIAFLLMRLQKATRIAERFGLAGLLVVPVTAMILSVRYDCQPNPVVWFIAMIVVSCIVLAAALKFTNFEHA